MVFDDEKGRDEAKTETPRFAFLSSWRKPEEGGPEEESDPPKSQIVHPPSGIHGVRVDFSTRVSFIYCIIFILFLFIFLRPKRTEAVPKTYQIKKTTAAAAESNAVRALAIKSHVESTAPCRLCVQPPPSSTPTGRPSRAQSPLLSSLVRWPFIVSKQGGRLPRHTADHAASTIRR